MLSKVKNVIKKILGKIISILKGKYRLPFIVVIVAIIIALNVAITMFINPFVTILFDVICVAIPGFLCLVNFMTVLWLGKERPTSYFQDLRFRNMEGIVVGSTKAWKYTNLKGLENKIYNCTTYKRSLSMDFATLKTYFGHVKKGGNVYFVVDYSECVELGYKILPRDYIYIHPHIFLALNKKGDKVQEKFPVIYTPKFAFGYFFCKLLKNMGVYSNRTWKLENKKKSDINTNTVKQVVDRLSVIEEFCKERDLNIRFILLNGNAINNCANEIIKGYLAPKDTDLRILSNASELNGVFKA